MIILITLVPYRIHSYIYIHMPYHILNDHISNLLLLLFTYIFIYITHISLYYYQNYLICNIMTLPYTYNLMPLFNTPYIISYSIINLSYPPNLLFFILTHLIYLIYLIPHSPQPKINYIISPHYISSLTQISTNISQITLYSLDNSLSFNMPSLFYITFLPFLFFYDFPSL